MSATKSTSKLNRSGYDWPTDKRKRRRLHRRAAVSLRAQGGGGIIGGVVRWHLNNARWLGR